MSISTAYVVNYAVKAIGFLSLRLPVEWDGKSKRIFHLVLVTFLFSLQLALARSNSLSCSRNKCERVIAKIVGPFLLPAEYTSDFVVLIESLPKIGQLAGNGLHLKLCFCLEALLFALWFA